MWVRWVGANGTLYPRGWRATMLRKEELMDEEQDFEYAPVVRLEELLAPDSDQSGSSDESMADNFVGSDALDEE